MATITVKELIKQLRKHPDHTPVYMTKASKKQGVRALYAIEGVSLHIYETFIFISPGDKKHVEERKG